MLHIVNGDATVARLTPADLPGEILVWRDILVEGPVERDLEVDALAALGDTPRAFADVFREATQDARMRGHGLGDVQLAACLRALSAGERPLVTIDDERSAPAPMMTFTVTDEGRAVRAGLVAA